MPNQPLGVVGGGPRWRMGVSAAAGGDDRRGRSADQDIGRPRRVRTSCGHRNAHALCVPKTSSGLIWWQNRLPSASMIALFYLLLALSASAFKSKSRLAAENAALRRQLTVLRRKVRGRIRFTNCDRWFLIQLYRWFPSVLKAITIIRPETLVRWHRTGFRRYWR